LAPWAFLFNQTQKVDEALTDRAHKSIKAGPGILEGVAESKPAARHLPNSLIRLVMVFWALSVAFLYAYGFYHLMAGEREPGFKWVGYAILAHLVVSWKWRWLQKKGSVGAPVAP
jgi:hypothetical protein